MSFQIKKIVLHNRAPFEHIELNFQNKGITLLSAVNGGGKTTVLSHIADAWYEIVRRAYPNEYEGKENKYYRVSSGIFSLDNNKPSYASIQFTMGDKIIDYLDLRGLITKAEYTRLFSSEYGIKFENIKDALENAGNIKECSQNDVKLLKQIFQNNLVTYFPSYRHEQPGYLNDPFKVRLEYGLTSNFSGYLINPVEIIADLPLLANWLMDIILDHSLLVGNNSVQVLFNNINSVFSSVLSVKSGSVLSLGVGQRSQGATRIQIGERDDTGKWIKTVYPSIFNMSSGENALVCLFCEIVRQYDKIRPNVPIQSVTGIILIDEIDKHLHIRMQKDVLPVLIQLFPNVQFILSSHSPFVAMGLDGNTTLKERTQILDLDSQGMVSDLSVTHVFIEGYNAMLEKNEQYKAMYDALKSKIESAKLQIVTEGHNEKHIKRAIEIIDGSLLDKIEFCFGDKTGWQQLKNAYDATFFSKPFAKYLFVFDCDSGDSVEQLPENENFYRFRLAHNNGNNKVKKGIENLYPSELFTESHYISKEESDDYGARKKYEVFNRNAFLETIHADNDVTHFQNFLPLIEKIKVILLPTQEKLSVDEEITHE
jgi:predicted ATP-binding protein involved in virulence